MNIMNKKGVARFGDLLSNLASGKIKSYEYPRYQIPDWPIKENEFMFISNINIINVNSGKIMEERGVLIKDKKIYELITNKVL